ncbi:Arginase/deacetylase [Schizophyllum commune Loenen D]|nr:Arginase/deacetylase [Schizophyllum commune Loenen D]
MLRHRDTDSELGALYLVPNREGTGKTLVRRPNPPPTSPPLDDDFDAMTQAGTTTRGAQTEWGTHLRESRAFTATPLGSDFDACTYTAAPGETRSEWQMGVGQANATRGTTQTTSPRKGPESSSTRVLAGEGRQTPSRAGSVARHATGRSGSEWGQSQDGWPQGPPRGAVVRRSPTTTSRASSKRLPNPPSERDWPPPVRRETEIIQGNTEFSMVRRRVLEDSPQKTVTISTWREQVAEEAAQATEPEPEMSVYFVGADDYPESVMPVPGSTRVIEEVRGLGMDSSARSASPPMLPQGTTPPRKASYGSRADSRRTGTSSSPRSLPSPPPRTSTPNGVNSPTAQLNRRYTHSRRGSSPNRRIQSSLFHPTQSGATISSIKTPEGAFDRVLDSCEPSLLHIAPVLESLGMTSEEHLRAVARLSEDTRDKEIREEALRMGVTIVEWAILIDKLQSFYGKLAGLRNRLMRLDKAKTGRREEACPQADFPRERRVAVASINPKLNSPASGGQHTFYVQNKCFDHRYIRSTDLSAIVERPERLRAVLIGLSAANSRLGELVASTSAAEVKRESTPSDDLADALSRLDIGPNKDAGKGDLEQAWSVRHTEAAVKILDNPAVKFVHGDIDGDVYLENLSKWAKESTEKIQQGGSEIPEGYAQGDLYLCPESIDAMQGAMGTVCEAVDDVIAGRTRRAFAAIRPPGHHCGEDTPSGFCFVNNVVVGAAHAHLTHEIRRVVVFDIDLHHGNGTQSLIWQINEETYRQTLESEAGAPDVKPGPQMYYSSLHDILSYPCEDGKPALVKAASVSIRGEHGQHVENVHLQTWKSQEEFDALYQSQYTKIIRRAEEFLDKTGGPGKDVLVFVSCGFDACEHEYESMQRHKRNVPTSLYYQFARDACAFADRYADGRLISVLEGGYGDRALISGSLAHLCGLSDLPGVRPEWWQVDNLVKLEKATKKRRGGRTSLTTTPEPWLDRATAHFDALKERIPALSEKGKSSKAPLPPRSMQLRQRKKPGEPMTPPTSRPSSVAASPAPARKNKQPQLAVESTTSDSSSLTESSEEEMPKPVADASAAKKLPRVVLKLGPRPQEG